MIMLSNLTKIKFSYQVKIIIDLWKQGKPVDFPLLGVRKYQNW